MCREELTLGCWFLIITVTVAQVRPSPESAATAVGREEPQETQVSRLLLCASHLWGSTF